MSKRIYTKFKIVVLVFIVIAFVSVTYAWFISLTETNVKATVNIRAWNVEFTDEDVSVTNSIVITSTEIYPGMETITEYIEINNLGDSSARLSANVKEARILDENLFETDPVRTAKEIEESLAHDYPFHINVSISDELLPYRTGYSVFEVSISWPLDTGNDVMDTEWGLKAYEFAESENNKLIANPEYIIRNPIEILINVSAEQEIQGSNGESDKNYRLGDVVLYDVVNNTGCTSISDTCLRTNVIDIDNKVQSNTVTLLPDVKKVHDLSTYDNYNNTLNTITNSWTINYEPLTVEHILPIISKDIVDSHIVKEGFSNIVIGSLNFEGRLEQTITNTINYGGYFTYLNTEFDYLYSSECIWTTSEYDIDNGFKIGAVDANRSSINKTLKTDNCKVIPVIKADKAALTTN